MKKEDEEPDILYFQFYLDAFKELATCRNSGMGLSPIPFTAIVEYSRVFEVEDLEEFLYLIRLMDDTLLSLESKKQKAKENK